MKKSFTQIALAIALGASLVVPTAAAAAAPKPKQSPPPPPPVQPVDLALTLTDSPDPWIATMDWLDDGDLAGVTYLADVKNQSTSKATSVKLDVDFDIETLGPQFRVGSVSSSQGKCTAVVSEYSSWVRKAVTCELGEIAAGAAASVEIEVHACGGYGLAGGRGTVKAAEPDPITGNNSASQETLVEDSMTVCLA